MHSPMIMLAYRSKRMGTINVIVKDDDGATILNSSIIDNTTQSFSNSERIIAKIHDTNVNASNTLELSSPTLELDVSDITVTTSGTTTHTMLDISASLLT